MASENGRLQADALFLGLTRRPMIAGVSYSFFVLNAALCMLSFIWTSNFLVLFVMAPFIHGCAYVVCMREPRQLELLVLRMGRGMRCLNRLCHDRTNSYDVF